MVAKKKRVRVSKKFKKKGLGWLPDVPDARDHPFKLKRFVRYPSEVDLREECPPIQDQGSLGSCTAQALVSALEFLEMKYNEPFVDYSRLFLYYNERVFINTVEEDSGAIIRDGIKSLNRKGICPEDLWPYEVVGFASKPSPACYKEAKKHKTVSYQRINTFDQMRACIATGHPFVFGFAVYDSFYQADNGGIVPMPNLTENMLGGHAVLCVGYNNSDKSFICQNSWGTGWGDKGFFYMPYEYLRNKNLSDDFWVLRF